MAEHAVAHADLKKKTALSVLWSVVRVAWSTIATNPNSRRGTYTQTGASVAGPAATVAATVTAAAHVSAAAVHPTRPAIVMIILGCRPGTTQVPDLPRAVSRDVEQ